MILFHFNLERNIYHETEKVTEMKKRLLLWLFALFLLTAGTASAQFDITEPGQLNSPGITVGVGQGSAAEDTVRKLLPQAFVNFH